ncbi:MAG TPA: hypothetical protein VK466_14630, partial [Terriglobales bacterium]|nr:hypothetical protein [Terriglobales bacterium]
MPWLVLLILLASTANSLLGQSGSHQQAGASAATVILHRRVERSCDLLQRAKLFSESGYASVLVDGSTEQIYSPEIDKETFVEYQSGLSEEFIKLARKSGFRMKAVSAPPANDLPGVEASGRDSPCPGVEAAIREVEQERIERRRDIQSKVFKIGSGFTPPEA